MWKMLRKRKEKWRLETRIEIDTRLVPRLQGCTRKRDHVKPQATNGNSWYSSSPLSHLFLFLRTQFDLHVLFPVLKIPHSRKDLGLKESDFCELRVFNPTVTCKCVPPTCLEAIFLGLDRWATITVLSYLEIIGTLDWEASISVHYIIKMSEEGKKTQPPLVDSILQFGKQAFDPELSESTRRADISKFNSLLERLVQKGFSKNGH
jgi:hypothetical protein